MVDISERIAALSPEQRELLQKRLAEANASAAETNSAPRRNYAQSCVLSFSQQRLWFLDQFEPDSSLYNVPSALRLTGELDIPALEQSLTSIVRRHESLRTTFSLVDGEPVQIIQEAAEHRLEIADLTGLEEEPRRREADRLIKEEALRPFDLRRGPVFRASLLRLAADEHILLLTLHHIVSDGWSQGVLRRELSALYNAYSQGEPNTLPQLPIQYADYAVWQREWLQGEALEQQIGYWKQNLQGAPALLELPTDRPRPAVQSFQGSLKQFEFPPELTQALSLLSQREGATQFMTLLAAFYVLLSRYSGQQDIVVGTPIANRTHSETEGLIGFFMNTLALRGDLSGDPTFRELLTRVRATALRAYAHQDLPFEKLVEDLQPERSMSHSPLFQVMFTLQNASAGTLELNGLHTASAGRGGVTAKFDLTLGLTQHEERLYAWLEYNTDLFDKDRIDRMLAHYGTLLEGIIANPDERISRLALLPQPELDKLLVEWNDTACEYPKDRCVHQLFEEQVQRTPDATALVFEDQALTYRDLDARANQLARYLQQEGVGSDVLVGLCVDRSLDMVVGMLGILKAGGAYVPLDPSWPTERLGLIAQNSHMALVLTQCSVENALPSNLRARIYLDQDQQLLEQGGREPVVSGVLPSNLAYVLHTSGSTGVPKGVQITHQAVVNFLCSMGKRPGLCSTDTLLAVTTISFDIAGLELWLPLLIGARVVIAGRDATIDGGLLSGLLLSSGATVMQATPATWRMLLASGWPGQSGLTVLCGGEGLPRDLADSLLSCCGQLWNLYGPTETTIWSSVEQITAADLICIGRPIANTQMYVLDQRMQPVPVGVSGALYIGGDGLSRGYLHRADLTAEQFIPDPFTPSGGSRLYRTGDSARYLADGRLECLGRADHQVKVRGFRIELGEIESALLSHFGLRAAVVVAREDVPGDKRLVAYIVGDAEKLSVAELREHLHGRIPEYMVPSAFVFLDALPQTPNGKVDRKSLPAPDTTAVQEDTYAPPRTYVEEGLSEIWKSVLHVDRIGVRDNFFELGGHSLLATQVMSRIRNTFSTDIPLRALFEAPSIAGLAECIEAAFGEESPGVPPMVRVSREQPLPLSFAQQRLWFLDQFEPGSSVYNIPMALRLAGALNTDALQESLGKMIHRHEALRTTFPLVDGDPVQTIQEPSDHCLEIVDLSGLEVEPRMYEADRLIQDEAQRPFDLQQGPLFRARLLRLADEEHILLLTLHHIVSDGWSQGVLRRELCTLYNVFSQGKPNTLPELPVQYADYAAWQRSWLQGEALEQQIDYWKQNLQGAPALLELPTNRPRPPAQTFNGALKRLQLPEPLSQSLKQLGQREGTTLFMTLLAAFQVLLYRYSGQEDIVVGTPIANRTQSETEGVIGFFTNTLALRGDLSGDPSFRELLSRVRTTALGAYTHQDLPFEKLVEELQPERSMSHSPLFQVMFTVQNETNSAIEFEGLKLAGAGAERVTANFDLTIALFERAGTLHGALEYNTDLFDEDCMERMLGHYKTLLERIVSNPEQKVYQLPMLSQEERHQQIVVWNGAPAEYPRDLCIHEMFEAQVERTPEAVAVVLGDEHLSYLELNRRANRLASHLRLCGIGPDDSVAVLMGRSSDLLVTMLGILKAGGAYVPFDEKSPQDRIRHVLKATRASVVVTQTVFRDMFTDYEGQVICFDQQCLPPSENGDRNAARTLVPANLAYIIHTSGSTGVPRGVMVTHQSLVNAYYAWEDRYGLRTSVSVHLQLANCAFDVFTGEWVRALCSGGRLVMCQRDCLLDPEQLYGLMRRELVDIAEFVPGLVRPLVEYLRSSGRRLDFLRLISVGSDLWHVEEHAALQNLCGADTRIVNSYGLTETTIDSSYFENTELKLPEEGPDPIGRPFPNNSLYVLERNMEPAPVGLVRELYVGGSGVTRGYLERPELTAEKFVPDPFSRVPGCRLYRTGDLARYLADGNIEFVGRMDHQVKIRGFRIELGEIETALLGVAGVRESVVLAREDIPGEKRLVAYIVSAESGLSVSLLRAHLLDKLPGYMVPAAFVFLESLPLSSNGKIDRKALPAPDVSGIPEETHVAPRTPIEEGLTEIWGAVLHVERIGVHDDFFELGGHSLLATQVMSRIRNTFQIELPLRALFEATTIAELALRISGTGEDDGRGVPALVPISRQGRLPLSFAQQRLWFIDQLEPQSSLYNIPMALRLSGALNMDALQQSLDTIVARHEVLRTTFAFGEGEPYQVIREPAGCCLKFVDLSGVEDGYREQEAHRLVQEEVQLPFDLQHGPLFRAGLLRLRNDEHFLLLTLHHIVSDGWSQKMLRRELSAVYNAAIEGRPSPLPDLSLQYPDFAAWQRTWVQGKVTETQLSYWRAQLNSAAFGLPIRADRADSLAPTFKPGIQDFAYSAAIAHSIEDVSRHERSSLFIVLLAVFNVLLYQDSVQEDICVGTPVSGRRWTETEDMIGLFLNTLVIRSNLTGNPSFRELVRRVRNTVLAAHAHQDVPFEQVVDALKPQRDLGHTPLFRVWFTFAESTPASAECSGLVMSSVSAMVPLARYALHMHVYRDAGGLRGQLIYQTDIFDAETIQRLAMKMDLLLSVVAGDADLLLSDIAERLIQVDRQSRVEQEKRMDESNRIKLGRRTRVITQGYGG